MEDNAGYVQLNLDSTKRFRESTLRREDDASRSQPTDKCGFVDVCLMLSGIGFLLPYNCFISAVDYYHHRFPGLQRHNSRLDVAMYVRVLLQVPPSCLTSASYTSASPSSASSPPTRSWTQCRCASASTSDTQWRLWSCCTSPSSTSRSSCGDLRPTSPRSLQLRWSHSARQVSSYQFCVFIDHIGKRNHVENIG